MATTARQIPGKRAVAGGGSGRGGNTSSATQSKHGHKRLVCLVLIVKDEEHVIERCLRAAAPFIDTYCICDTGSTDKTKEVIFKTMSSLGIFGVIKDHKWERFSINRTKSLEESRDFCPDGWSWVVDADDEIKGIPPGAGWWNAVEDTVDGIHLFTRYKGD